MSPGDAPEGIVTCIGRNRSTQQHRTPLEDEGKLEERRKKRNIIGEFLLL
jgi:hypothetical protein